MEEHHNLKKSGHSNININNYQHNDSQGTGGGKKTVVRNHTTAVILSILFGWLGVDRFYVGHIGLGLLKLFTMGCYGVWWVIDIILFATKKVNYVRWE